MPRLLATSQECYLFFVLYATFWLDLVSYFCLPGKRATGKGRKIYKVRGRGEKSKRGTGANSARGNNHRKKKIAN